MKTITQIILSIIISAVVFAVFYSFFNINALFSFLFGLAGFIGAFLLLSPKKINPKLEQLEKVHGINPEQVRKIIKDGNVKISSMKKAAQKIQEQEIKDKIDNICQLCDKIFKDFEEDPKDIRVSREFLNYYLDAAVKIINRYVHLKEKKADAENDGTLKKVEDVMTRIEASFEKQLSKLYEDDFMDLDAEISVLKKSIEMEGLGKK